MREFIAGLLFAAAATMPGDVARRLDQEVWADLVDAEHLLYLVHMGPAAGWVPGDDGEGS